MVIALFYISCEPLNPYKTMQFVFRTRMTQSMATWYSQTSCSTFVANIHETSELCMMDPRGNQK